MITRRTALLLPLALGTLAACSPRDAAVVGGSVADSPVGSGAAAMMTTARDERALGAEAFAKAIEAPETIVIDVRTPDEFAAGHIEGARNLDVSSSGFEDTLEQLDPDATYAVYCRSGTRSATALAVMDHLGFTETYHLDGGIGAWTRAGQPLVTP